MSRLSDADIERLRRGDSELFRELVRGHTESLVTWVCSYAEGPDEVEDLVQDVWRRVLEARAAYRGTGSFRGWLYQIARTVCVDHARGRASRTRLRADEVSRRRAGRAPGSVGCSPPSPEAALEASTTRLEIRRAVEALPPRQRDVVTLRLLQGLSTRETAEVMRCAEGTVKASLSHALRKLRDHLEPGHAP